jgi:hypothetical protein
MLLVSKRTGIQTWTPLSHMVLCGKEVLYYLSSKIYYLCKFSLSAHEEPHENACKYMHIQCIIIFYICHLSCCNYFTMQYAIIKYKHYEYLVNYHLVCMWDHSQQWCSKVSPQKKKKKIALPNIKAPIWLKGLLDYSNEMF